MPETFLTIQEAADISGKSIQTIRRAIKSNRITCKRKRTPQGFNYMISREGLIRLYRLQASLFDRDRAGLEMGRKKNGVEYATFEELKKLQEDFENVVTDNKKERENFMRFMKAFQEKFVVLENQMKLLEQPKKRWFKFWS